MGISDRFLFGVTRTKGFSFQAYREQGGWRAKGGKGGSRGVEKRLEAIMGQTHSRVGQTRANLHHACRSILILVKISREGDHRERLLLLQIVHSASIIDGGDIARRRHDGTRSPSQRWRRQRDAWRLFREYAVSSGEFVSDAWVPWGAAHRRDGFRVPPIRSDGSDRRVPVWSVAHLEDDERRYDGYDGGEDIGGHP